MKTSSTGSSRMSGDSPGQFHSDRSTTTTLRREAQWLTWNDMSSSQRLAFARIVRAFRDAVAMSDQISRDIDNSQRPTPRTFYEAPRERPNTTCLITGDRGTGKSSLLMTLARATTLGWKPIFSHDTNQESLSGTELISQDLAFLETRLVWLDPLDMELQEKHTNLLAAILTRVEIALERVRDIHEGATELLRGLTRQSEQAIVELNRLMGDVSAGWDGNLPQRAGALDPDSFATEVLRVERARADLTERMGLVLENLSRHFPWPRTVSRPLFVLPIDDFDLNSDHIQNVLRLIRILHYTPNNSRLVVVVLGDIEVATETLTLMTLGERARLSKIRPDSNESDIRRFLLEDLHEFTSEALRKALPLAQRTELRKLSSEEILNFRPNASTLRLWEMLDRMPFRFIALRESKRIQTLLDFLVGTPFNNCEPYAETPASSLLGGDRPSRHCSVDDGKLVDFTEHYAVCRHHEVSLRHVVDMWHRLVDIAASPVAHPMPQATLSHLERVALAQAQGFLVDLYREAIEADSRLVDLLLDEDLRHRLTHVLEMKVTRDGKRWTLDDGVISAACRSSGERSIGVLKARDVCQTSANVAAVVNVWQRGEWVLSAVKPQSQERREFQLRTNCMFMLAHDVFALSRTFPLENPATPLPTHVRVANTTWRIQPSVRVDVEWLAPRFRSFWGWDHFKAAWFDAVRAISDLVSYTSMGGRRDGGIAEMAYRWVLIGTAILDQRQFPLVVNPQRDGTPDWTKSFQDSDPDWDHLLERLNQLVQDVTIGSQFRALEGDTVEMCASVMAPAIDAWLVGLCNLACPESGLPVEIADRIWSHLQRAFDPAKPMGDILAERVIMRRKEVALRFIQADADELAWDLFRPSRRNSFGENRRRKRLKDDEDRIMEWLDDAIFMVGEIVTRVGARQLLSVRRNSQERAARHLEDVLIKLGFREPRFDRQVAQLSAAEWERLDLPRLFSTLRVIERFLSRPKSRTLFRVVPFEAEDVANLLNRYPDDMDQPRDDTVLDTMSDSSSMARPMILNPVNDWNDGRLCPSEEWFEEQFAERDEQRQMRRQR